MAAWEEESELVCCRFAGAPAGVFGGWHGVTHPVRERSVEGYKAGGMKQLEWKKHSIPEIGPVTQKSATFSQQPTRSCH